jgi:hypothetical protein
MVFNRNTALAVDTRIRFFRASIDPAGDPTTGLVEWPDAPFNEASHGGIADYMQNKIWPREQYLNVVVYKNSDNYMGYAPGYWNPTDAVFIDYRCFGSNGSWIPFHHGRILIHEIGHWLNLFHLFETAENSSECGDDFVADTPNRNNFLRRNEDNCWDWRNGCDQEDYWSWQNYMDCPEAGDDLTCLFTEGQKSRMNAFLTNERATVWYRQVPFQNSDLQTNQNLGGNLTIGFIPNSSGSTFLVPSSSNFSIKTDEEFRNSKKHMKWSNGRN